VPHWREHNPPGDKLVNEGDDVVFDCQADGIPRPQITWFINGSPIECTFRRIAVFIFLHFVEKCDFTYRSTITILKIYNEGI